MSVVMIGTKGCVLKSAMDVRSYKPLWPILSFSSVFITNKTDNAAGKHQ